MKRIALLLLVSLATNPAWAATQSKTSIQQLRELLTSLQAAKKTDAEIATELKRIELAEELTPGAMASLAPLVPGPLTNEQIYVLEARSAILPPPPADIPATPAPDSAAQQAMLAKAYDYVAKTYAALPALSASRMTARFQDGVEAVTTYSGARHSVGENSDPIWEHNTTNVRLLNTGTTSIELENGIEKPPATKDTTKWGPNGMTISTGPALTLSTLMQEIKANGNLHWLRWELISGQPAAVYAFNLDRKKTHFTIVYCCFPNTDTTGLVNYSSGTAGGSNASNLQTVSEWKPFKAQTGYRGELFLDPATGVVLRTITQADFKPTDFVHFEAIRTDYAPFTLADKTLVVPVRRFTLAEVVPNGDSFAAKYAVRHSFLTQNYSDFKPAGAIAQK